MYQYSNTGKVYGVMPPPIDEHAILRHVGKGMQMGSNHIQMIKE
jgi:hypothetical protein